MEMVEFEGALSKIRVLSGKTLFMLFFFISSCFAAEMPDYTLAIPAGALLGVSIVALAKMVGSGTNNSGVSAWANIELADLIAGAILSMVAFAVVAATPSYLSILVGDNAIELGNSTLNDSINNIVISLDTVSKINSKLTAIGGTSFAYSYVGTVFGLGKSVYWTPAAGVYALMPPVSQAQFSLSTFLFAFLALKMMLSLIVSMVPTILLPISIFLRLIPFTKRLGSTLIALSLALYIGFPASLMFVREVNSIIAPQPALSNDIEKVKVDFGSGGEIMESVCTSNTLRGVLGLNEVGWGLMVCPIVCAATGPGFAACFVSCFWQIIPRVYGIVTGINMIVFSIAIATSVNSALEGLEPGNLYYVVYDMMLNVHKIGFSAFMDIATIAIVLFLLFRAISAAIGGEKYLSSMERLL
ncbi:MAG: hypothetical protein QW035_04600 [Candidatus Anstonellales archaeon]